MAVTNRDSGTNVHEIAEGIYRINTPVAIEGGPEHSLSINISSSIRTRCCFTPDRAKCFRWYAKRWPA